MTYIIRQYDPYSDIWFTVKESPNLDDFSMDDKLAFNLILKNGDYYVEEGTRSAYLAVSDRMWTIDKETV